VSLNEIKSKEDKEIYMIKCMEKTVKSGIEDWRRKYEDKERTRAINDMFESRNKGFRRPEDNGDLFSWLRIRTKYRYLINKSII
jgi:hypothetical protein